VSVIRSVTNKVVGTVIVRESKVGIPNLLVTLYEGNFTTESRDHENAPGPKDIDLSRWDRLGSVITNDRGTFDITYDIEKDATKSRHKVDLLLTISSPEENSIGDKENRNIATCIRRNVASIESFLISVEKRKLDAFGIHVLNETDRVDEMIKRRRAAQEYRDRLESESRKVMAERLRKRRELEMTAESKFSKFLSAISAVPESRSLSASKHVPTGRSVKSANEEVIRSNIRTRVNTASATTSIMLSDSQADALKNPTSGVFVSEVSSSQIDPLLHPNSGAVLVWRRPPLIECNLGPRDPCTAVLEDSESEGNGHNGPAGQDVIKIAARTNDSSVTPIPELSVAISDSSRIIVDGYTPVSQNVDAGTQLTVVARDNGQYTFAKWEDGSTERTRTITPASGTTQLLAYYDVAPQSTIPALVGDMFKYLTPPDSSTILQVQNRAGIEDIQTGVNAFTLHSGPADVPAFYDFYNLKIAFEHVWQEVFDGTFIKDVKKLYTDLVELDVDPNDYLLSEGEIDLHPPGELFKGGGFSSQMGATAASTDTLIPAAVAGEFGITQETWSYLSSELQQGLENIIDKINAKKVELDQDVASRDAAPVNLGVGLDNPELSAYLQTMDHQISFTTEEITSLHEQGEAIIRSVTPLESPDDKFAKYDKRLQDLGRALKESYRFSIYAANGKERSINFGILTTYRQRWEPVSYQVGQLVKTIPLAPKEVRRFTKKVTTKTSRAEKEVENNLQSRKTEASETSRAEKEIIQKAQNKTNFKLTAEGGVHIAIADVKGGSEFDKEASVESQEVKKEFRESVFKAAEEYKSERTVLVLVRKLQLKNQERLAIQMTRSQSRTCFMSCSDDSVSAKRFTR
jgi:hypothetical protein